MDINILSVDWDYFFPDPVALGFDWGADEDGKNAAFFWELAWTLRVYQRDANNDLAIESFVPRERLICNFWKRLIFEPPYRLFITNSHHDIYPLLEQLDTVSYKNNVRLVNYDAHHDLGYNNPQREFTDCGNWAYHALSNGLIANYHAIYPYWRKKCEEPILYDTFNFPKKKAHVGYMRPHAIMKDGLYHYIFICRSSAFTPSWSDLKWMFFIQWWRNKYPSVWENKITAPYAMQPRKVNIEAAKAVFRQSQSALNKCKKEIANGILD